MRKVGITVPPVVGEGDVADEARLAVLKGGEKRSPPLEVGASERESAAEEGEGEGEKGFRNDAEPEEIAATVMSVLVDSRVEFLEDLDDEFGGEGELAPVRVREVRRLKGEGRASVACSGGRWNVPCRYHHLHRGRERGKEGGWAKEGQKVSEGRARVEGREGRTLGSVDSISALLCAALTLALISSEGKETSLHQLKETRTTTLLASAQSREKERIVRLLLRSRRLYSVTHTAPAPLHFLPSFSSNAGTQFSGQSAGQAVSTLSLLYSTRRTPSS